MFANENVQSFSTKKSASKGNGSASKRETTPARKFGLQSPNVSNISGMSARSGEFHTPTGTIDISSGDINKATEMTPVEDDQIINTSIDISTDIMNVFSQRRMTVDAATALGIISDLEKAQTAMR
jgi:hypothetical protein